MGNNSIFAGKRSFDIGCRVIKWDEKDGLDFTPKGKYIRQNNISEDELKSQLKQFCVHWSVTYRAKQMFTGLVAEGLSSNFMIDDDVDENGYATVFQCLDCTHGGWTQGGSFNTSARGVELSYMPQAWENKNLYSDANIKKWDVQPHEMKVGKVHGVNMNVFLPTEAQMKSLYQLLWGITQLFPDIPTKFPRDNEGNFLLTTLPKGSTFTGFINHYNVTRDKIDTCGLDLQTIEQEVEKRKQVAV
jgi:N-acetyl-anhydromuramyl-L-alanine amidase AmpD